MRAALIFQAEFSQHIGKAVIGPESIEDRIGIEVGQVRVASPIRAIELGEESIRISQPCIGISNVEIGKVLGIARDKHLLKQSQGISTMACHGVSVTEPSLNERVPRRKLKSFLIFTDGKVVFALMLECHPG